MSRIPYRSPYGSRYQNPYSSFYYLGDGRLERLRVAVELALALPCLLSDALRQPLAGGLGEDDLAEAWIFLDPFRESHLLWHVVWDDRLDVDNL